MTQRHLGRAEIEGAYQWLGERAVDIVNEGNEHPNLVLLMQMSRIVPGQVDDSVPAPPEVMKEAFHPSKRKHLRMMIRDMLFPSALRTSLLRVGRAPDIVAVVSEAWLVRKILKKGEKLQLDKGEPMPHAHPERQDALIVLLHTADGSYYGHSFIETIDGKRHATLGPMQEGELEGSLAIQHDTTRPPGATRQ